MAQDKDPQRERPTTSPPPESQNQATRSPGTPDRDEAAIEAGRERLDRVEAGH